MSRRRLLTLSVLLMTTSLLTSPALADNPPGPFWVFVGTFTAGNSQSRGIYRMEFNPETGHLSDPVLAVESPNPAFLAVHPSRKTLYSVNELAEYAGKPQGSVSAFTLDPITGSLSPINVQASGGATPCHLALDPLGKNLLVANYSAGSVAVLPVRDDGGLSPISHLQEHTGSGPDARRQKAPHAHAVLVTPENDLVLSADLGADRVFISRLNPDKGTLSPSDPPSASLDPGSGPRHLALSPDGKHLYVINEMASTLSAFSFDARKGPLTLIQTLSTLPEGFSGSNTTAEIQIHPSGKFVYGSNRGHDSLAIFRRDPQTGKLTPIGHELSGGKEPRNFAIDPTGAYLLAANQNSNSIVVFRIDPTTGKLSPTGAQTRITKPVCIQFVPRDL